MSKQFLQVLTLPNVHPSDIFSVAVTQDHLLSASGSASIQVHTTKNGAAIHSDNPAEENPIRLTQTLEQAHLLGCHHVCSASEGSTAASVGFGGEVKVWTLSEDGQWIEKALIASKSCSLIL